MIVCANHTCNAQFEPTHSKQKYCCKECKAQADYYRRKQGSKDIDLVGQSVSKLYIKYGGNLQEIAAHLPTYYQDITLSELADQIEACRLTKKAQTAGKLWGAMQ